MKGERIRLPTALDKQIEERALVYHDDALEGRLANLAAPLLPSDKLEHVNWRFRTLRDPAVNTFGLPNGSIYLNMGLLSRAENDDQVAGRLAHEIAHGQAGTPINVTGCSEISFS